MSEKDDHEQRWRGKKIEVRILYSRAGVAQHIWIEGEEGSVLVDAGDGLIRDLLTCKLDPKRIRGIIFTHGHFDHVGGLHSFLGFLRMIGRKETLPIHAPQGCTEVFSIADNFVKCYPDTIPFPISCREHEPQEVFKVAGLTIKAYPVIHCGSIEGAGILDPIPALGYRISHKGETIAISGDTGVCPSLKELVKGADLAIIEATHHRSERVDKDVLKKVHLSEDLAREIGKLAKDFMLVHRGKSE
jgi:ribonuclease BN (tRNA processing enzyme)